MSEPKYNLEQPQKRVSLDEVTTSSEERAKVEANMNTPQENATVDAHNAKREADQQALWKKQAERARSQSSGERRNTQNVLYVDQLKENGIVHLSELGLLIKKISPFLLTQPVEWRREYAKESAECLQAKDFFEGYADLSDKEREIFEMLKNDTEASTIVKKIFSSEVEQDDFIKKSIRVDHKTEYTMCLTDLFDSTK